MSPAEGSKKNIVDDKVNERCLNPQTTVPQKKAARPKQSDSSP